jgi:hypothetical protein
MRVRIVAPAKYACIWQVVREKIAQPIDAVVRCPRLLAVSVQAVDSDNARVALVGRKTEWKGRVLDDGVSALRYHLQALGNYGSWFCWRRRRGFCRCLIKCKSVRKRGELDTSTFALLFFDLK